ncbi:MAG: hypothetical protein VYE22_04220 [Myxococcota bacterium]|nr:hypothetical protein [Myxococcota bacterium]
MEPTPETTVAVCAAHEGAAATGTCARCGNNVCPACLEPDGALPDHCESCRERVGGGVIPWERAGEPWFRRWLNTTRQMLLRPTDTLEGCAPGPWTAAFGYAAVTGGAVAAVQTSLLLCGAGCLLAFGMWESVIGPEAQDPLFAAIAIGVAVAYPLILVGWHLFMVGMRALIFHAGVAISGGGRGLAVSVWGTSYVHAIQLTTLVAAILGNLPVVGPVISMLVYLAIEVWTAIQLTTLARVRHDLPPNRAALAGWMPFLVFTVLGLGCCVLTIVFFASMPWLDP